jgi:hypothetical protein
LCHPWAPPERGGGDDELVGQLFLLRQAYRLGCLKAKTVMIR